MSVETWRAKYPVFSNGEFRKISLREVVSLKNEQEPNPFIWSARLSSGLFGLVNCPAGNNPHAPKGEDEVLLALGSGGLKELIDLGFVPCPACHPEETPGFWEMAKEVVEHDYLYLDNAEQILNRELVPFDARRVEWERLAPYLTKMPNRLYIPPDLNEAEVIEFKERINGIGFDLPPVGFYDRTSPKRFTEYIIK